MARKKSVVVKSLADPIPEQRSRGSENRMFRISGFDSLSAKHICYVRELERLAFECEDYLGLLEGAPGEDQVREMSRRMRERIDMIFKMSRG